MTISAQLQEAARKRLRLSVTWKQEGAKWVATVGVKRFGVVMKMEQYGFVVKLEAWGPTEDLPSYKTLRNAQRAMEKMAPVDKKAERAARQVEDDLSHLHLLHPDTKLKKARAPGTRGPVKARGAGSKGRSGIDGHGGDNPRVRF